ncbi:phosphomannomutase [Friedmanniella luteola]|uniref:Phosphomannomutase n=1 Tax=Friedmanniella luteola TaxID=546871 RepID=A0A1H1YFN4_9ACTN|nr:phosphomannomutase/phosphoglucomutase [Friedmanniella luteola]SDT20155.1 phosphomannomutase [Friedmanniella luteola]
MITQEIFKANDIRGITEGPDPQWDEAGAFAIGVALVDVLGLPPGAQLVLGRDMRVSGERMSAAFTDGVLSRGVDVLDIGLASTDELWFASGRLDRPGAMFTASHNPAAYNGIKFCLPGARPIDPAQLVEIAERAQGTPPGPAAARGTRTEQDLLPAYAEHLLSLVDLSGIRRLTVVADAGNGMAGHTLPAVLGTLDLELIGLYTDPDGTFPNHQPNPLEPENLVDAQNAVREHGADLALVFDGDADRCFVIDERGEVVTPSTVTAMIARAELQREPGSTVVCNKITSWSVPEIVQELGGEIVITRVGHTFVKAAMAEHDAIFGGEHSAHYYFRDFWGADTGMLAALHVLALLGHGDEPLSSLSAAYTRYVPSGELNSTVTDAPAAIARVEEAFTGRGQADHVDGLTVAGDDWWVNVRPSNTEPLLRLNVEARTGAMMESLRDEVLGLIRR